jgi:CheY-like chemotaxis protein
VRCRLPSRWSETFVSGWRPEMDGIEAALRIRRQRPDVVVLLLTATRQATLDNLSLAIEDKRDLSPRWLAQFWQRHGPT